ncbi:AAA family ATPase [Terrabacter terrigena]|uniref:AAA family ATPase n=1 Tax=Terrabacter terrigena TaxID=574718 RepID=A0ABW3N1P2_9MICO
MDAIDSRFAPFARLTLSNWRQFGEVEIDFHPNLTVLTGANGSGKSTLLNILGRHFNWSRAFSFAPIARKGVNVWSPGGSPFVRNTAPWIGQLTYGTGHMTNMSVPEGTPSERQQYEVSFDNGLQQVRGIYLTSHRAIPGNYAGISAIPALFSSPEQILEQFTTEVRTRWLGGYSGRTPTLALKESLISAAVFGEGNQSVEPNPTAQDIWVGFQEVLRSVMPASLGFQRLRIRMPDVLLETGSGDFIFEEASGGLSSIIEMSWQIFLRSRDKPDFVVLIDEPENHLHPSLQKEIIPSLLRAFPKVQFVVATHSPFVVTASPDSAVYVLDYDENRRVNSAKLDYANKAASAERTLTRVLGLESTTPRWAEEKFDSIIERYVSDSLTSEQLRSLRRELEENGLESEFPNAIISVTDDSPYRGDYR